MNEQKKTTNVITRWEDVTLMHYNALQAIIQDTSLVGRPIATAVHNIDVLSDLSTSELLNLDQENIEILMKKVAFLSNTVELFEGDTFKIDEVEYHYIKNEGLSTGEMISIEQLLIDQQLTPGKSTLAAQLAILIRPVNEKEFDIQALEAREELFLEKLTVPFFFGLLIDGTTTEAK